MDAIALVGLVLGPPSLVLLAVVAVRLLRLLQLVDAVTARAVAETRRAEAETAALRAQEERVLLEMETYDDDE